jgi:hypothetical protein
VLQLSVATHWNEDQMTIKGLTEQPPHALLQLARVLAWWSSRSLVVALSGWRECVQERKKLAHAAKKVSVEHKLWRDVGFEQFSSPMLVPVRTACSIDPQVCLCMCS